jgi:hypothetical protein
LPGVLDLGPGSPTGLEFGHRTNFPAPWRDALFALDWTFGTIRAIQFSSSGASVAATAETFMTGEPLPVADAVANTRDGALYVVLGGRGVASAIYRVRWTGEAAPSKPAQRVAAVDPALERRHRLEALHRPDAPAGAVAEIWPLLDDDDRFVRFAARTALEHQPPERWVDRISTERNPGRAIAAVIAAARVGGTGATHQPRARPAAPSPHRGRACAGERPRLKLTLARDPLALASPQRPLSPAFSDPLALAAGLIPRLVLALAGWIAVRSMIARRDPLAPLRLSLARPPALAPPRSRSPRSGSRSPGRPPLAAATVVVAPALPGRRTSIGITSRPRGRDPESAAPLVEALARGVAVTCELAATSAVSALTRSAEVKAVPSASAAAKRSSGAFASARRITAATAAGASSAASVGGSLSICIASSRLGFGSMNGGRPVIISSAIAPSEYTSLAAPHGSPLARSGDA